MENYYICEKTDGAETEKKIIVFERSSAQVAWARYESGLQPL